MRHTKAVYMRAAAGFLVSLSIFLLPVLVASAVTPNGSITPSPNVPNGSITPDQNTQFNSSNSQSNTLQNPLGVSSFCQLIKVLLNAALVIGIPIAVLFIVYAGFKFILARGSATALTEARSNLFYTLVGVAIFIGASVIAGIIINTLAALGATNISSC